MKNKKDIFDVLRSMRKVEIQVIEKYGDCNLCSKTINTVIDIILGAYGIPNKQQDNLDAIDLLAQFSDGLLSKDKITRELRNW